MPVETESEGWRLIVLTGLDRIAEGHTHLPVSGNAGLLTNQSGITRSFLSAVEVLRDQDGVELSLLFSPEHGLYGEAQDQVLIEEERDPISGLPVVTLYGSSRKPQPHHLEGIDLVIVDLQDAGSRFYTFSYTMALVMEAAADAGIPVVVLDRPNPIGGDGLEGNVVQKSHFTFVGLYPLAVRHGMTMGELARFYNSECGIRSSLHIIPMEGWKRTMHWQDTGLPWIPPSPNMPHAGTALVYPGTCLLEGTNLSEGRGTTRPFELVGAPFIDPERLRREIAALSLPGIALRPAFFEPTFSKWKGEKCGGLWLHVQDRVIFKPFLTGLALIQQVRRLYPESFCWREPPYEDEHTILPIDMLMGTASLRQKIEEGDDLREIERSWKYELEEFEEVRRNHLLY